MKAELQGLGWSVAETNDDDVGTDLFAGARDERLFDLGLIVGIQVKTGDSWFGEPQQEPDGAVTGWWFRDSDRQHSDYWLGHQLPHLLVLRNIDTAKSFWVHVTPESVVSTGKGAKILVPAANTIDEDHRQDLLDVAATSQVIPAWEGSVWTGTDSLLPRDLLRYALTVPRLVAPHPNAGHGRPLSPEQAVALVTQARLDDLSEFAARHSAVPTLSEAASSKDWTWRFVSALASRLTSNDLDGLTACVQDAPNPAASTAATVAVASAKLEQGNADDALRLLQDALSSDYAEPVDHAWLTVQHARACIDVGHLQDAQRSALAVQPIRTSHSHDVTASALAGVASELLFHASDWGERHMSSMIAGADTFATWWRTQTAASGFSAAIEQRFEDWAANDSAIIRRRTDKASIKLVSSAIAASHLGDHSDWCYFTEVLAQHTLQRTEGTTSADQVAPALTDLRLSGAREAVKAATRRVVDDGPWQAIQHAASQVQLAVSTRTTASSDLALLRYGARALDTETADHATSWLLAALTDPTSYTGRVSPSFHVELYLAETLSAVLRTASNQARSSVIDHILNLPAQDDLMAQPWARTVDVLLQDWNSTTAIRAGEVAASHDNVLRRALEHVAALHDADLRTALVTEIQAGGVPGALGAFGDVRDLPSAAVTACLTRLGKALPQIAAMARRGGGALRASDPAQTTALLNSWHPDLADWQPLLNVLENPAVSSRDKSGALRLLAWRARDLPEPTRERLAVTAKVAEETPPTAVPWIVRDDARGEATHLLAALKVIESQHAATRLLELIRGGRPQRELAALVAGQLGEPEHVGLLAAMTRDPDPAVRAAAGASIGRLLAAGGGGLLAEGTFRHCLADGGLKVPATIARVLAVHARTEAAEPFLAELRAHPSVYVQRCAAQRPMTAVDG